MQPEDDSLERYIHKMMQLQGDKSNRPMSEEELKEVAYSLGMTEQDWQNAQLASTNHLKSGQGHLAYRNWDSAIGELEAAVSISPYHVEALLALANAYKGRYLEKHLPADRTSAETFAQRALQFYPGHPQALRTLSEIRQGAKFAGERSAMKKYAKYVFLALSAAILFFSYVSVNNQVVEKGQSVAKSWAQVENVYQRRADLIPNLVEVVKAAANTEQATLEKVIQARAAATSVRVDANALSANELQAFMEKQGELSSALGRLMVVSEQYPELRSTQGFRDLQVQIEGAENRISVERRRFNEAVMDYNAFVGKFPYSLLGKKEKAYFEMRPGAGEAPKVVF